MLLIRLIIIAFKALLIGLAATVCFGVNPLLIATPIFLLNLLFSYNKSETRGVFREGLDIQDTSYAGEVLANFIARATTGFQTLQKGCINILPGIKKSMTIPTIKVDNFMQAPQETPVHGGNIGVGARTLTPVDHMGYLQFNPRKFEQHWYAVQQNAKLLDQNLPRTAESAIIQEVLKYNGNWMEKAVWQSIKDDAAITTALSSGLGPGDNNMIFMDGLLKKMFDASNVLKVLSTDATNPAETLTAANIFSKFDQVRALVPQEEYDNPKFKWMVSFNTGQIYGDAQKAQPNKGVDKTQKAEMMFDGKPVVTLQGMPNNTIVGCLGSRDLQSNLWLGVHEIEEEMYLDFKRLQANSELWFIKMLMKMDVNFAFEEATVLYTTLDLS